MPANESIERLIEGMTLEEKVGQMTQITLGVVRSEQSDGVKKLDAKKLKEAIQTYHVGSILNADYNAMTVEQWRALISEITEEALKTRAKIPVLYGIDSIHGATYIKGATLFPHNIGLAASRDSHLVQQIAKATALQTRAAGIRWNFDAVLDMGREPLWPRFEETFGEDTFVVTQMGLAAFEGYEGGDLTSPQQIASTMKHFIGYGVPASGKDRTPSFLSPIELWDTHMPPFEAAIKQGVSSLMVNSGTLNGIPVHADGVLLKTVLREKLGFKGVIVSDWEDVMRLHTRHRVARTQEEAVELAVNAGLDISMVPEDFSFFTHLVNLVKKGKITEARIDESVRRILTLKASVGLFDQPYPEQGIEQNAHLPTHQQLALKAAKDSLVLLKNEGNTLPLKKSGHILIAGPAADSRAALSGSWSYSWQGSLESQYPDDFLSVKEALINYIGTDKVIALSERPFDNSVNTDVARFKALVKQADKVILVLGEDAYAEGPGVIDDLDLSSNQEYLAKAAIASGKPVILVLAQGRPRIIRRIEPSMDAILAAHRPGSLGGRAIIETLYGEFNPSGRLPYTYPRYSGDVFTYDHQASSLFRHSSPADVHADAYQPQWPFGFGLSYSTIKYSSLKLDRSVLSDGKPLTLSLMVKNESALSADHSVEVYITDQFASVSPAVRKLKAFQKINLGPNEKRLVKFKLNFEDFSMLDQNLKRIVEPGMFTISVGDLSKEITYKAK